MLGEVRRSYRRWKKVRRQTRGLGAVAPRPCSAERLRRTRRGELDALLLSGEIEREWLRLEGDLEPESRIEDGRTAGVNPGDRRALFHLVRALRPRKVLEIGTHVGASTFYIAAALRCSPVDGPEASARLTTVDVEDVNDAATGAWKRYGLVRSPRQMMESFGYADLVRFECEDSVRFLERCEGRYDFVFLDGSHDAGVVYREIPLALRALREGGTVLLHDYFPHNRPLWSNGKVVPGPFLAVRRLREEGAEIAALPLGQLPWPTKLRSRVTSLALLTRE